MYKFCKRWFCVALSAMIVGVTYQVESKAMLVFDENVSYEIPRNFRTSRDPFLPSSDIVLQPGRLGLYELQAAASAQFSERTLKNAIKQLPGAIWMVDLRRESHIFFNGLPVSWYAQRNATNLQLTAEQVLTMELTWLSELQLGQSLIVQDIIKKNAGVILESKPVEVIISQLESEKQLTQRLGIGYSRFLVQDHHRPDDETVDQFIELVKNLKPNTWLYFHCRAGKGRSTTFMVLYDILKNAKTVSLDDILLRQKRLGGSYFGHLSVKPESAWKLEPAKERKAFIEQFYRYATDPEGYPKQRWSEWLVTRTQD